MFTKWRVLKTVALTVVLATASVIGVTYFWPDVPRFVLVTLGAFSSVWAVHVTC